MKVSFTHLIGYAIIRALEDHPAMGHSFQEVDGKPHRIVPAARQPRPRRRRPARRRLAHADRAGDQGRRAMDFARYREVYEDLIAKTRNGDMSPDDLQGATVTLTNPGGIGTVASVPRLMPGQGCIIATGAIRAAGPAWSGRPTAEEGDDDDLHLRPPRDPGRRVGRVPRAGSRSCCSGEDGFYEAVFESLGLRALPAPAPLRRRRAAAPRRRAPAPVRRRCSTTCRRRPRS